MQICRSTDSGSSGTAGMSYLMQWESLDANRDKPRLPPLPDASTLRVYQIKDTE